MTEPWENDQYIVFANKATHSCKYPPNPIRGTLIECKICGKYWKYKRKGWRRAWFYGGGD